MLQPARGLSLPAAGWDARLESQVGASGWGARLALLGIARKARGHCGRERVASCERGRDRGDRAEPVGKGAGASGNSADLSGARRQSGGRRRAPHGRQAGSRWETGWPGGRRPAKALTHWANHAGLLQKNAKSERPRCMPEALQCRLCAQAEEALGKEDAAD